MSGNLYAKIDVQLCRRPEMITVGPLARLLYLQAILYAKEHKTDGIVAQSVLNLVAIDIGKPKLQAAKLVDAGLFEVCPEGWRIPLDVWRKWNPTRAEIEETRAQKARAGTIGNHERWHSPESPNARCDLCINAGWYRKSIANASQGAITMSSPETETETETETIAVSPSTFLQGAVDNSGRKIDEVVQRMVTARCQGKNIVSHGHYRRTVAGDIRTEHLERITELVTKFPTAPVDVIANAVETGETRTLTYYVEQETQ